MLNPVHFRYLAILLSSILSPICLADSTYYFDKDLTYCSHQGELIETETQYVIRYTYIQVFDSTNPKQGGSIFIGYLNPNNPSRLWLMDFVGQGTEINLEQDYFVSKSYTHSSPDLAIKPIQLTLNKSFVESGGQIWIGYGISSNVDENERFQEMLQNKRYFQLWQIGHSGPLTSEEICYTINKIYTYIPLTQPN